MHPEAQELFRKFLQKYYSGEGVPRILDVGSYNVNGSLKDLLQEYLGILVTTKTPEAHQKTPRKLDYVGLDQQKGPNVDVVGDAHRIPFEGESFDMIISSSCFEHDQMFWVTFSEMSRVLKPGGILYICVPSTGPYQADARNARKASVPRIPRGLLALLQGFMGSPREMVSLA